MDGYEGQNGAYTWYLRGQLDRTELPPSERFLFVLIPVGLCQQIATFVVPLLVMVGWM